MNFDFWKRIYDLQERLKRENLDVLLVATVEGNSKNIFYLSGFGCSDGVLAVSQKDAVLAVDGRYILRAREETKGIRVVDSRVSDRRIIDHTNYVRPAIGALSLGRDARIGFEAGRVSVSMAEAWKALKIGVFVPTNFFVEALRQRKDSDEIECLSRAGEVTGRVFEECVKYIKEGIREADVAKQLDITLRAHGALENSFRTIVASGPNSAIAHHATGERKLKAGDPVVVDFGGVFAEGYCSDMTRTVFVPGKSPDDKLLEVYAVVREANEAALRALRAGMRWKDYDDVARSCITKRGYGDYFTHGLGHSIGLEVHDPYNYEEVSFEEGVVVTDEPGIYLPYVGGVRIEDELVVTKDGARSLTPAPYLFSA